MGYRSICHDDRTVRMGRQNRTVQILKTSQNGITILGEDYTSLYPPTCPTLYPLLYYLPSVSYSDLIEQAFVFKAFYVQPQLKILACKYI
jgi:hypothetical protein